MFASATYHVRALLPNLQLTAIAKVYWLTILEMGNTAKQDLTV